MTTANERTIPINLRVPKVQKDLIDKAAQVSGKTRTDFILEAAAREAEDVMLDQRLFAISPAQYEKFLAALDAPVQPNSRLIDLMRKTPRWDNIPSHTPPSR